MPFSMNGLGRLQGMGTPVGGCLHTQAHVGVLPGPHALADRSLCWQLPWGHEQRFRPPSGCHSRLGDVKSLTEEGIKT